MGLNQICLTNYDTVVAVTQAAVNETLAVYLDQLQKQVSLAYNVDSNGNFVPAPDPNTAAYMFTGTLDYTLDANGNPVDIVELYTDAGNQTIIYNLTFSAAEFKSTAPGVQFDIQQQEGSPWIIKFRVKLNTTPVALSNLPAHTQAAVRAAVSNLGPDLFSIQQLYADLNTAVFDSFQNITGMSSFATAILTQMMQVYLASLQSSGGLIFGHAVTASSSNTAPPTFLPTALGFCITPYLNASGAHSNPGLDTLNYLIMTNNNPLPSTLPTSFPFNWVDDASLQGAIAVRSALYRQYLIEQLNPLLQTISCQCSVHPGPPWNVDEQGLKLAPGWSATPAFTPVNPPVSGLIAQFSCQNGPAELENGDATGPWAKAKLTYSASCSVTAHGSTVVVAGSHTVAATTEVGGGPNDDELKMPPASYPWNVQLLLEMDPTDNGQLSYAIQTSNFDASPTVAHGDQHAWDKFTRKVTGAFQDFANDPGSIRSNLQAQMSNTILPALTASINRSNAFVFPGGNTFVFKNPSFTASEDLAANITYQTPSAAAAPRPAPAV